MHLACFRRWSNFFGPANLFVSPCIQCSTVVWSSQDGRGFEPRPRNFLWVFFVFFITFFSFLDEKRSILMQEKYYLSCNCHFYCNSSLISSKITLFCPSSSYFGQITTNYAQNKNGRSIGPGNGPKVLRNCIGKEKRI